MPSENKNVDYCFDLLSQVGLFCVFASRFCANNAPYSICGHYHVSRHMFPWLLVGSTFNQGSLCLGTAYYGQDAEGLFSTRPGLFSACVESCMCHRHVHTSPQ